MNAITQAQIERDAGMAQALQHAQDVDESWPERAFRHLIDYAEAHDTFISHDVTEGLPSPTDDRSWGPIFKRAAKVGIIKRAGFGVSHRRHLSPTILWQSCIYVGSSEVLSHG